jgi:hypothetical protein
VDFVPPHQSTSQTASPQGEAQISDFICHSRFGSGCKENHPEGLQLALRDAFRPLPPNGACGEHFDFDKGIVVDWEAYIFIFRMEEKNNAISFSEKNKNKQQLFGYL